MQYAVFSVPTETWPGDPALRFPGADAAVSLLLPAACWMLLVLLPEILERRPTLRIGVATKHAPPGELNPTCLLMVLIVEFSDLIPAIIDKL